MSKIKGFFKMLGDKFERHPLIFCIFLSIIENFAIECMSRRSFMAGIKHVIESPTVFFYNALIILLTLSVCLLFKRRVFGVVLLSAPWLICGLINNVVLSYRVTPLGAIDFQIVKLSLMLVYLTKFQRILVYVGAVLLVVGIVTLWILGPKISGKVNYGKNVATIVGVLIVVAIATNLGLHMKAISDDFGNIAGAYKDYGFVYCFSSSMLDTGIKKPEGYSQEKTEEILNSLPPVTDSTDKVKPDIMIVQLESFLDPKAIKGVTFSDDPAPIHTYLRQHYQAGKFDVPSLGGGTANTEFEVLSGISLDYFGPGEYPYKTIMLEETVESLPFNLEKLGYCSHAIHNHTGNFYDRDKVYPHMGFTTFQSREYMNDYETTPYGWCKDKSLVGEILNALDYTDEKKGITEDTPKFVWTVSVQGHGAYPTEPIKGADNVITLQSDKYSEPELCALQYFSNQVWEMDMFLGSLISAVENRGKPAIIFAYGDHLPALGFENEDLTSNDVYSTEYVSWNNLGLEKDDKEIASYELASEIMAKLGFNDGNLVRLHQKKLEKGSTLSEEEYQADIHYLAYDQLYGKNYQFGGTKPYKKKDMQMGTIPIEIQAVSYMGDSLYIQGKGFTEKSKVFVNGEKCESTIMLSQYSLMAPGAKVSDGDKITVGQASSKREVLSYSEPVIYDSGEHFLEEEPSEEEKSE